MSKAAKQSIIILAVLLLAAVGFAGYALIQQQQLETQKVSLEKEIDHYQSREKKYIVEKKDLEKKLEEIEANKSELETKLGDVNSQVDGLNQKLSNLLKEKDSLQSRVDHILKERDDLVVKLQEKPEPRIIYKNTEQEHKTAGTQEAKAGTGTEYPKIPLDEDSYWARVVKEKKSLEIDLADLKSKFDKNELQLAEFKKENSDLQLELSHLQNEKATISREIKYGNDLSDSLALDFARAQNDKKFLRDRLAKMNTDNEELRGQIKRLTSTKIALEKSVVRLQEEKKEVERKLHETENIIQGRIDQIWEIKDDLEKTFRSTKASKSTGVELPPIVVSNPSSGLEPEASVALQGTGRFNGNIVSVNEDNNFVIVDIGKERGLKVGDDLNVYRGEDFIAGLVVIQVRDDIAAADIKNKTTDIKVGDIIR